MYMYIYIVSNRITDHTDSITKIYQIFKGEVHSI